MKDVSNASQVVANQVKLYDLVRLVMVLDKFQDLQEASLEIFNRSSHVVLVAVKEK